MNRKHPSAQGKRFALWRETLPPADRMTNTEYAPDKSTAPYGTDAASVPGSGSLVFLLLESPATSTDPHTTSLTGFRGYL